MTKKLDALAAKSCCPYGFLLSLPGASLKEKAAALSNDGVSYRSLQRWRTGKACLKAETGSPDCRIYIGEYLGEPHPYPAPVCVERPDENDSSGHDPEKSSEAPETEQPCCSGRSRS